MQLLFLHDTITCTLYARSSSPHIHHSLVIQITSPSSPLSIITLCILNSMVYTNYPVHVDLCSLIRSAYIVVQRYRNLHHRHIQRRRSNLYYLNLPKSLNVCQLVVTHHMLQYNILCLNHMTLFIYSCSDYCKV